MTGYPWLKKYRLRNRLDFIKVQTQGKRFQTRNLIVLFQSQNGDCSRIGLTVSKKVGNAVVRNKIKRILREVIRREYSQIIGCFDVVFIARPSIVRSSGIQIKNQITHVFQKISSESR